MSILHYYLFILFYYFTFITTQPSSSSSLDTSSHVLMNDNLFPLLNQLVQNPYFRYVKIDLTKSCPFWEQNLQCMNRDCNVNILDEQAIRNEVPWMYHNINLGDIINMNQLPTINSNKKSLGFMLSNCQFSYDFCILEDEHSNNGVYVDLADNPERYTGYSGESANSIWTAIYNENCFDVPNQLTFSTSDVCLEKQTFYKIVSGLHASISIHICSQYLNKNTGEWIRNLPCYWHRVGKYLDRVNNVYFVHAMLLRALIKVSPLLSNWDICTGKPTEDNHAKSLLNNIITIASNTTNSFDESQLFKGADAISLVNEVRTKFRNISQIMDCVSCQKCRLWGKTQITGIGTALKILFSLDQRILNGDMTPPKPVLSRYEIVAFINTLNRFVESVHDIQLFDEQRNEVIENTTSSTSTSSSENDDIIPPSLSPFETLITSSLLLNNLWIWKVIATVLTALPFLFGAIYGVRQTTNSTSTTTTTTE